MRRKLKFIISILLILCFLASPISVLATSVTEIATMLDDIDRETKTRAQNEEEIVATETEKDLEIQDAKGQIEVVVAFDLPILNKNNKQIKLIIKNSENREIVNQNINLFATNNLGNNISVKILDKELNEVSSTQNGECYYLYITVKNVPRDVYSVNLSGQSYVTYTYENLDITNNSQRLIVSNTKGTFAIGNIAGNDNIIDEKDYEALKSKIGTKDNLEIYDLNNDGEIDLIDLSYIANNMASDSENAKLQVRQPIVSKGKVTAIYANENIDIKDLIDPTKNTPIAFMASEEGEPISVKIDYGEETLVADKIVIDHGTAEENIPSKMTIEVEYEDENGAIQTKTLKYPDEPEEVHGYSLSLARANGDAEDGPIEINLGGQIAVKKITIRITATMAKQSLEENKTPKFAEIATVELLNDVYNELELPKPDMSIPEGLTLSAGDKTITARWGRANNITGYKLSYTPVTLNNDNEVVTRGETRYVTTTSETYSFSDLTNEQAYEINVESINGIWESGYTSNPQIATPIPNGLPPVPEGISTKGAYKVISINWKNMSKEGVTGYYVYYRVEGTEQWTKTNLLTQNSLKLNNLNANTTYDVKISCVNRHGEGRASAIYKVKSTDNSLPNTYDYGLINTKKELGELSDHIIDITGPNITETSKAWMSDNDYSTYWYVADWETGAFNNINPRGPIVTLDDDYELGSIIVIPAETQLRNYDYSRVIYWYHDENGTVKQGQTSAPGYGAHTFTRKTDESGKIYYEAVFAEPVKAFKVQFAFTNSGNSGTQTIAEIKFYKYDELDKKVSELYGEDSLKTELSEQLKTEMQKSTDGTYKEALKIVNDLREEARNKVDPNCGEHHPRLNTLELEIDYVEQLIRDGVGENDIITVDQGVSNSYNNELGFSYTLNDLQPLGIVAKPEDNQIIIYVGVTNRARGSSANMNVVFTQYFPEYSNWKTYTKALVVGRNVINVPNPNTVSSEAEKGGAVYVQYTGNSVNSTVDYKVRVNGGTKIPVLDLHNPSEIDVNKAITDYVTELENYVQNLPQGKKTIQVVNSTDIVLPNVMLSIPADRALAGLGTGNTSSKVTNMYNNYCAWDEMIGLFYKEKGLTNPSKKNTGSDKHAKPGSRLNIRYTRMFTGAFMYAAGGHIGVGYGSCSGLMTGKPMFNEDKSKNDDWSYFGWGIAHEIGHVIDQSGYASAETTNNIYSLFAQTADDNRTSRLENSNKYTSIYKKVTSHTQGVPGDVFTYLGMYWQLHLAYDTEPNMTSTDTFYSRLHREYRTDSTTSGMEKFDKLICLASKAANADLTDFFKAWGIIPTDENKVKEYINNNNLQPDGRAIYYLNDEARRYRLGKENKNIEKIDAIVTANILKPDGKYVETSNGELIINDTKISLTFNIDSTRDDILGYEVLRNGESVGFVNPSKNENGQILNNTTASFTDELNAINNRVLEYAVVVYNKLGVEVGRTNAGIVKVQNTGEMEKTSFTAVSNMITKTVNEQEEYEDPSLGENASFENVYELTNVKNVLDGDINTEFVGNTFAEIDGKPDNEETTEENEPYITIELNGIYSVAGIRYTSAKNGVNWESSYAIQTSKDNVNWETMSEGSMKPEQINGTEIIYFDGLRGKNQLNTATCGYVRLINTSGKAISAAEIDIIAPTGDNIEFDESRNDGIYKLVNEGGFIYAEGQSIPKNSVVIKTTFKGYLLYNTVMLKFKNNKGEEVIGSLETDTVYDEIFAADIPQVGELLEVKDGTCMIYMTEEMYNQLLKEGIEELKVELYRVDDAISLKGQRLVADTFYIQMPNTLENMTITKNTTGNTNDVTGTIEAKTSQPEEN